MLAQARDGRYIYVEVKGNDVSWVPYIKAEVAKAKNANPGNVLFISFGDKVCAELKRQMPDYRVYFLTSPKTYGAEALVAKLGELGVDGVDIAFVEPLIDQAYVETVKSAGYSFHVWTVDDPAKAQRAFALGAETLTTNRAKYLLDSYNRSRFGE